MQNSFKYQMFSALQRGGCCALVKFVAAVDFWFSILSFLSMLYYILFVEDIFS